MERQPYLDPDHLFYLDETAATTKLISRYERDPNGQRCRITMLHSHYMTTFITAVLLAMVLIANITFEEETNGTRFCAYVTNILAPALKLGDIVSPTI